MTEPEPTTIPTREEAESAMLALGLYRSLPELVQHAYDARARAIITASYHFTPTAIARELGVQRKTVYDALARDTPAAHEARRRRQTGRTS